MNPLDHSIVLIGMMGAGKSTVGAVLQRRTGIPCIDLDDVMEEKAGASIADIFTQKGESGFRDLESKILTDVPTSLRAIIVTGGGIVQRPENQAKLRQLGTIVWLDADPEILFARATENRLRPLLASAEDPKKTFVELLLNRRPIYQQLAHVRIDTSGLTQVETADTTLREVAALTERD
jgi:shikimate kinase